MCVVCDVDLAPHHDSVANLHLFDCRNVDKIARGDVVSDENTGRKSRTVVFHNRLKAEVDASSEIAADVNVTTSSNICIGAYTETGTRMDLPRNPRTYCPADKPPVH